MKILFLLMNFLIIYKAVENPENIIRQKLWNQADCWNSGDIECFMKDYWNSDHLLFIGKTGITYGWQNTLENYRKRYPSKKEMGKLKFNILELRKISEEHYFMVGKWHLTREMGDLSGHFSLLWQNIDGNWLIVADHSS